MQRKRFTSLRLSSFTFSKRPDLRFSDNFNSVDSSGPDYRSKRSTIRTAKHPTDQATTQSVFFLSETFTEAPSRETDMAWASLVPGILRMRFKFACWWPSSWARLHPSWYPWKVVAVRRGSPARPIAGSSDLCFPPIALSCDFSQQRSNRSATLTSFVNVLQDALRIGYYATNASNRNDGGFASKHRHSTAHMKHCFDYICQALVCAADLTLEPLLPPQKGISPGADGWGVEHTCRRWDEVLKWTEERRASG